MRNIAEVTTAVANGDLSQKITVEAKGEVAELAETINTMVDQLSRSPTEVTRVAREVGTEGKLGGQAEVEGVSGTWKDLTDNVNSMADNLTDQVRNIAEVTTAVANGDLTRKITVDAQGEILELKNTINTMVDQLSSFADEVTRVAREVGTEGILGGQAEVKGVSRHVEGPHRQRELHGDQPDAQVRNIAQVTTAVANGDLTQKITVDARARSPSSRTRSTRWSTSSRRSPTRSRASRARSAPRASSAARRGRGRVRHVEGPDRQREPLAVNLTDQVRNIAQVTTAVANGDLTQEDHRRRPRRDARAQGHDQHDGRPAARRSPPR